MYVKLGQRSQSGTEKRCAADSRDCETTTLDQSFVRCSLERRPPVAAIGLRFRVGTLCSAATTRIADTTTGIYVTMTGNFSNDVFRSLDLDLETILFSTELRTTGFHGKFPRH